MAPGAVGAVPQMAERRRPKSGKSRSAWGRDKSQIRKSLEAVPVGQQTQQAEVVYFHPAMLLTPDGKRQRQNNSTRLTHPVNV